MLSNLIAKQPEPVVFDPYKTRVIVLTWPDNALTTHAAQWLWRNWKEHSTNVICWSQKGFYDVVRCAAVDQFCLKAPKHIEQFVFMDRDMRPEQASDPVLTAPGDIVGCFYETGNPKAWASPTVIHMGLVRISRQVLETLAEERDEHNRPKPMFFFPRDVTNTKLGMCECAYFAQRAIAAGFSITRAGWCGHK